MGFQQGSSLSASDKLSKQPGEEEQGLRCQNLCCSCCLLRVIALRGNIVMLRSSSLALQLMEAVKLALLHSAAGNKGHLGWRQGSGFRPSSPSEGHGWNAQRALPPELGSSHCKRQVFYPRTCSRLWKYCEFHHP